MALKTFQFPTFDEWVKTKNIKVEIGDYFAQIFHVKNHSQDDLMVEVFLARICSNNQNATEIESTTFIYIPDQFSNEDFKAVYDSTCELLNKAYKKHMYRTYWN